MKKIPKKYWVIPLVGLISVMVVLIIIDTIVLPYYVSASEYNVPDVVNLHKDEAIRILKNLNLNPIVSTSRYDQNFEKDHVMFQNPYPNTLVKEGRRVYLTVSGGEQTVKMPFLLNKTIRDAQITLERAGLVLDSIEEVESELPTNTIVEQQYPEGRDLFQGTSVSVKVSVGPKLGMVRVPNLLGKSLTDAENVLRSLSLHIGVKTFIQSTTLLPNTVVDQQPSQDDLVEVGDSIDVVLTQSKSNR